MNTEEVSPELAQYRRDKAEVIAALVRMYEARLQRECLPRFRGFLEREILVLGMSPLHALDPFLKEYQAEVAAAREAFAVVDRIDRERAARATSS